MRPRLSLVCGQVFIVLITATGVAQAPATLRTAARSHILIGAAVRPSLFSERAYAETLAREFDLVEPEDAMKWSVIRRHEGVFDFREGDKVVSFAEAHGMKVRGHCLVWDHIPPSGCQKASSPLMSYRRCYTSISRP